MASQFPLCPICLDEIHFVPTDDSSKKIHDGQFGNDCDGGENNDDLQQVEVPTTMDILPSDDHEPFHDVELGKSNDDHDANNSMCTNGGGIVSSIKSGGTGKPNDPQMDVVKVDGCGHNFCRACMQDYITVQLDDQRPHTGSKLPVCPMGGCSNTLPTDWIMENVLLSSTSDDEIKKGLDGINLESGEGKESERGEVIDKLLRIKQFAEMGDGAIIVECTACQHIFSPRTVITKMLQHGDDNNDVQCPRCKHEFCREHGDSHRSMNCATWRKSEDARRVKEVSLILVVWAKYSETNSEIHLGCNLNHG